jgi:hypothetical protein
MANQAGKMVQTIVVGTQTLNVSFLSGNCHLIPYPDMDVGDGFVVDGKAWVCDPLSDSYTEGTVKYPGSDGAKILNYRLDKNGLETSAVVAGVARFKLRLDINGRKLQYMRCAFNGDIFHPDYPCPSDWLALISW